MGKTGRPSSITEEIIQKFEQCYRDGSTDREACLVTGIPESTYYENLKNNKDFSDRIDIAKEYTTQLAKAIIARKVARGDLDTAKWWVERKNKKAFSSRTELSGPDGESLKIQIVEDTDLKEANEDSTEDKEL